MSAVPSSPKDSRTISSPLSGSEAATIPNLIHIPKGHGQSGNLQLGQGQDGCLVLGSITPGCRSANLIFVFGRERSGIFERTLEFSNRSVFVDCDSILKDEKIVMSANSDSDILLFEFI